MATDSIMLLPSLRPWQRAGVEFLLAEQPLPAPYSLCIAAQRPRTVQTGAAPCTPAQGARQPAPHGRPTQPASSPAPAGQVHTTPASAPAPIPPARGASAPPTTFAQSAASPAPAAALVPLAPELWPQVWQERLKKTAPAAVLWTYWTLGEDLCLRPDPARRALLQRLLADLAHPAGTHSFWPAALPAALSTTAADCDLQANPEVFWSGVQALKARALVVMGSPAIKALDLPPRLRPFQQTRHKGRLVVVLRDVDFLAQETHRYDAVREFLKQALAPFGR